MIQYKLAEDDGKFHIFMTDGDGLNVLTATIFNKPHAKIILRHLNHYANVKRDVKSDGDMFLTNGLAEITIS